MEYQYDLLVIGLGPAGMAATIMGHNMGLKVCAIEQKKLGGECMNVGCIPSKALLRIAKTKHSIENAAKMELEVNSKPILKHPFTKIQEQIDYIRNKKTSYMLEEVPIINDTAVFVDSHTVQISNKQSNAQQPITTQISAKIIFIATGTKPFIPPIPGIENVPFLTNDNLFNLEKIPASMIIIGGGAIGVEMAQAFSRLGTKCYIVHADPHIIGAGDKEAARILRGTLQLEDIVIYDQQKIGSLEYDGTKVKMLGNDGLELVTDKLLIAAGRSANLTSLALEKAGVKVNDRGFIEVGQNLQTSCKNIYAVGDCNGHRLFSHAAMHQSMLALMNAMSLPPLQFNFKKTIVPWTIFTEPQFSQVGMIEEELIAKNIKYETIKVNYQDYGAAIVEGIETGFVKVFVSSWGKIYGAVIIGEGAGDMIQEWALAIHNGILLHKIMFMQHSFPTMSFLNKRVAETWMLQKMQNPLVKKICRALFGRFVELKKLHKS